MLKNPGQVADAARADEFTYVADETLLAYATGMTLAKATKLLKGRTLQELADDPAMAGRLRACVVLAKRVQSPRLPARNAFQSSRDVVKAFGWLTDEVEEQVWVVYLNNRNQAIYEERITRGGPATATVDIRAILTRILKVGASAIVVVHNHPADNSEASCEDIELTTALLRACQAIDCQLLDHVIVAKSSSFSFLDASLLKLP